MGYLHLIRKNLGRKKMRTLFTGLTIAIAFLLFGLLGALNHAFSLGVELAGADRMVTIHKVSLIQLLPYSYRNRIASVDGVKAVSNFTWTGGYYQEPRNQIPTLPTDPDTLFEVYDDWEISSEQLESWRANRTGMLIGKALAESRDWKLGDRIPINSSIYTNLDGTRQWDLTVSGIFTAPDRNSELQILMHYDYFNESVTFGQDMAGWYAFRIDDPARADAIAAEIDSLFANSPAETKTSTEQGFVKNYAEQFGNIGAIVRGVLAAVFFTMLLVAGNTMTQAVRERTGEMAVMKTLGFSNGRVLGLVIGESLLLTVLAGLLGLGLAILLVIGLREGLQAFLPALAVTNRQIGIGLGLMILMGLITSILPALRTTRLDVISALGKR